MILTGGRHSVFWFEKCGVAASYVNTEYVMNDWYYLLALNEFWDDTDGERLFAEAFRKIDTSRREKAERIKPGKARAASVGAGLLLQLAVQEAMLGKDENSSVGKGNEVAPTIYTVSQILELVARPRELVMEYGKNGKPYLKDLPFFFNLSHSGEYVFCVLSDREVGADIQLCNSVDYGRLTGRFFSAGEQRALESCVEENEHQQLFFRLWTRKEAYGKLTGAGLVEVVGKNLLSGDDAETDLPLDWLEWSKPEGYRIAVCQYT